MSRDDYEDDEPRPRRKKRRFDDDYDDIPRRRGGRSGAVTGVGVLTIICGSLILLCGLCFSAAGIFAGAGAANPAFAGNPAMNLMQFGAAVVLIFAVLLLVMGSLYLAGGIGCIQRRNWGRIMTLVMAGFSALFGIYLIVNIIMMFARPAFPPGFNPPPGFNEGRIIGALISGLFMILALTHCVMSFVVLLSGQSAAEFDE